MNEREQLEAALVALEVLRSEWGAVAVDAAKAGIQRKLEELHPMPPVRTVVAVDVAATAEVLRGLSAEHVLNVMQAAFQIFGRTARNHSGEVLFITGDSLLAAFTLADDAVQAARAMVSDAYLLEQRFRRAYAIPSFKARAGIHTGELGPDRVVIDTAERLQVAAPPGGVVVSATTRDHLRTKPSLQSYQEILSLMTFLLK